MKGEFWIKLRKCRVLHLFMTLLFVGISIFSFSMNLVSADNTEAVDKVTLQSEDYLPDDSAKGSWVIDKSAKWTDINKARVAFDVKSIKMPSDKHRDVIMVLDISGSMDGDKLNRLKEDSNTLVDELTLDHKNRIAIITFSTDSTIEDNILLKDDAVSEKGFINVYNNSSFIHSRINSLAADGDTNYYAPLTNVSKLLGGYKDDNDNEIFPSYTRPDDTDLVMLFLTDGYPNKSTHLEVAESQRLKANYPYMKIHGIQYEMGNVMAQEIINISDDQWFASLDTLNNVLLYSAFNQQRYEKFEIEDYIDLTYFKPISANNARASTGVVTVEEVSSGAVKQKVTWTLNNLCTGSQEKLYIDLELKDDVDPSQNGDDFLYPTNTEEKVTYKKKDEPEKVVSSTSVPKLKQFNKVRNFNNEPGISLEIVDGKVTTPVNPDVTRSQRVNSSVDKQPQNVDVPSFSGWIFKGWKIITQNVTNINVDYFIMPSKDVDVVGTWGKVGIKKSMEAEEVSSTPEAADGEKATLMRGDDINKIMARLAGSTDVSASNDITKVTKIQYSDTLPDGFTKIDNLTYAMDNSGTLVLTTGKMTNSSLSEISNNQKIVNIAVAEDDSGNWISDTDNPVYMWFKEGTIYIKVPSSGAYLNPASGNMFSGCSNLVSVDLSKFDSSKVIEAYSIFADCSSLTSLDLSNFDVSNLVNSYGMFRGTSNLENITIGEQFNLSKITSLGHMFNGCKKLSGADIQAIVSRVSSKNVISMWATFGVCKQLTELDLSNLDTPKVDDISYFLDGCINLQSLKLGQFNTASVDDMRDAFRNCSNLEVLDISSFDTSKVSNMTQMFYNCTSLKTIYVSNTFVANTSSYGSSNIFQDCTKLVGGAGTVYNESKVGKDYAHIDGGKTNPGYFTDIADKPSNTPDPTNPDPTNPNPTDPTDPPINDDPVPMT